MKPEKTQDVRKGLHEINGTLLRIHWLDTTSSGPGWHWRVGHDCRGPYASSREALEEAEKVLGKIPSGSADMRR